MENQALTVYGPVRSWRFGRSLGIDPIAGESACSFNCTYCQLGNIIRMTDHRQIFVPTERVLADLQASSWQDADIITFSGNGEPTLALNLRELIEAVKACTGKPVLVLTNGTLLGDPEVRRDLRDADEVAVKLDAADDRHLQLVNRPVPGVTMESILQGTELFRREYSGKLALQVMLMPMNVAQADAIIRVIRRLCPDEVQLNTPTRPYPRRWVLGNRGGAVPGTESVRLRTISAEEADAIEYRIRVETAVPVISVYEPPGFPAEPSPATAAT